MHFSVDGIAGFKSPRLPSSVDTGLRVLLQHAGLVSEHTLSMVKEPEDSNYDVVARIPGYEVVADGSTVLQAVIEGLKRRLATQIAMNEKIRLVGEER
jgi:hypothetical protein